MKRREPLPFSGAQIQISSLFFFVWVSHTQLVRDPREPQTTTQPVFMSPPSTHPFLSLALSSSSSSPLLIALLIFPLTSEYEKGGGRKKSITNFPNPIDLLRQTFHWEFMLVQKS